MSLPLSSVRLVLVHLRTTKVADLNLAPIGQGYEPMFKSTLAEIDALPQGLSAEPFRDELDVGDDLHDAFHEASQGYIDMALVCPSVSKENKAFLSDVRLHFVPDAMERVASFAKEADKARERRALLPSYELKLKAWPVAPGQSLYDWVEGYISAGEQMHSFLEKRAEVLSKSRVEARRLRSLALGMLRDLRRGVKSAVRFNAALPRDLEASLFSYMDTLDDMAKNNAAHKAETPAAPEPAGPK